ncbi:M48 family metalloprotease [Candidatus Magnetominusculus dajiuhuensis]|uniref:M48 family metalloprotease n=1 Tax=Candidatus Magnetominusculus dajiuhuensis TaxID=3137712 RepID=UPI003B42DDA3
MKNLVTITLLVALVGCVPTLSSIPDTAIKVGTSVSKAARPIAPEEEYYIGRSVAARIMGSYKLLNSPEFTTYINLTGQTIAFHSEMPFTYGGYHFAILDSKEINAFACPGGIIFITKGMIDLAVNEDELAAILAHEIAHINHKDGLGAIKSSRWTEALTVMGSEAARQYTPGEVSQLLNVFEGSIDDVVKSLVTSGYSKAQEYAADESALVYLRASGYNPAALKDVLKNLQSKSTPTGGGVFKTHPSTEDRIAKVNERLTEYRVTDFFKIRSKRFSEHYNVFSR